MSSSLPKTENQKPTLRLDWCNHKAAHFAVMNWHYSKTMPLGKLVKIGVWENGLFIGVVIFGQGNTPTLGKSYGCTPFEVCELVRIALREHQTPVSRIGSIALKMLKAHSPGLRLVVSFADPSEGHNGSIYQAMNWVYTGQSAPATQWLLNGEWVHNRTITSGTFGSKRPLERYQDLPKREIPGKYRYLYPLDQEIKKRIKPLALPYPVKVETPKVENADG